MGNKIKSSIIIFLFAGLLLEISGNGLVNIIECSNKYVTKRCLGIGNDNPKEMMNDFFLLLTQNSHDLASNLLSKNLESYFNNMKGGIKGKNYFFNFWDIEVSTFNVKNIEVKHIGKSTARMEVNICYKRNTEYADKNKLPIDFCSTDRYTLIMKKNTKDSPYMWSIDTFCWKNCSENIT